MSSRELTAAQVRSPASVDDLRFGDEVQTVAFPVGDHLNYAFEVMRLAGA